MVHLPDALTRRLRWHRALAIYFERRLVFVFVMGFASGLPLLLTGATLSIWLTEAGTALTAIGLFALVGTPYNFKFLWAPLVDRVPLPVLTPLLGRRRSWMVVIQLLLLAAIMGLGATDPAADPWPTAALALAVAFLSASQDIVIDAYRIEILDPEQQGAGAAVTQAGYRLGLIVAGAGALYLAEWIDWRLVYTAMGLLVLVGFVAVLLAPLPPADREAPLGPVGWRDMAVEPFAELFTRNGAKLALVILAFILLYKLGDAFAGVMANPFYVRIGFTKSEIATVSKVFGVVATLTGVFVGGIVVARFGVLVALLGGGVLQMLSNLMFAAQAAIGPDVRFLFLTIGVENVSGGLGSAAFVAYLSVLCNARYTGTQFALFTSLMAAGRTWLAAGSGWVADQTDWVTFFVLSTFVAVPGLLVLAWMMRRLPIEQQTAASAKTAAGS